MSIFHQHSHPMLVLNENTSDYQILLERSKKTSMKMKRLRNLATEIFKTVNNLIQVSWKTYLHQKKMQEFALTTLLYIKLFTLCIFYIYGC